MERLLPAAEQGQQHTDQQRSPLLGLPPALLGRVLACVCTEQRGVRDLLAFACTSRAAQQAAADAGLACGGVQALACADAARERLAAVGAWRDGLLLAAWQQQQRVAAAAPPKLQQQVAGAGVRSPHLQRVLALPDAGAALIASELGPSCAGGGGAASSGGTSSSSSSSGPRQRQRSDGNIHSVDFSAFCVPSGSVLQAASCFVTDGVSTAMLQAAAAAAPAVAGAASAARAPGQQQQRQQGCGCGAPRLRLLKGHLPPADRHQPYRLHQQPLGSTGAGGSGGGGRNPVASLLVAHHEQHGLGHLRVALKHAWELAGCGSCEADGSGGGGVSAGVGGCGGRQLLLLPLPSPPGSVADLSHPWPPQLRAGSCYQPLSGPGAGLAGQRSSSALLREPLLCEEPALLLPGSAAGGRAALLASVQLPHAPAAWLRQLAHLDVSEQDLGDGQAASLLGACGGVKTLSLADTATSGLTWMVLGSTAAAQPAAQQLHTADGRSALGLTAAPAGPALASSSGHAAALHRGASGQAPVPVAGLGGPRAALVPAGSLLRVLDVSGCTSLAQSDASAAAFRLFWSALGRLVQLQVLLACRINVPAALLCRQGCDPRRPPPAGAATPNSCATCATLRRLCELDVSAASAVTAEALAWLLAACASCRCLGAAGCVTLAAGDGSAQLEAAVLQLGAQQAQQQQPAGPVDLPAHAGTVPPLRFRPGLLRLSLGWGWAPAAIASLLGGAQFLVSFSAGAGACVTDSVLQQLAHSCPHLQQLRLSLCPVSSAGVQAVLASCPKLTSLQLQQCVGPFAAADMLPASSTQRRWQLGVLQLAGPPLACSNGQLLQLLGLQPLRADGGADCASGCGAGGNGSSADCSAAQRAQVAACALQQLSIGAAVPVPHGRLTSLCLVRVLGLDDALLHHLGAACCQLQHLRLEDCTSGVGGSSSAAPQPAAACAPAFSEGALLQLLSDACGLSLRSLQLRHSVAPLSAGFVGAVIDAAPLLQRLVLDACDMAGFELEERLHGGLQAVHVVRCQHLAEPGALTQPEDQDQEQEHRHAHRHHHISAAAAADPGGRRKDKQLVVHLLQLGHSLHLPA